MAGDQSQEHMREISRKGVEARQRKKQEREAQKSQQAAPVALNEADAKPRIPEQPPIRKAGPDAASQKDLENWLGATLGLLTFGLGIWLAQGWTDEGEIVNAVALTDEELDALVPAVARLIARSDLNKRYGQLLIQSNDWLGAIMALAQYGSRVWPLVRYKLERGASNVNAEQVQRMAQPPDPAGNGATTGNGYAPGGLSSAYAT